MRTNPFSWNEAWLLEHHPRDGKWSWMSRVHDESQCEGQACTIHNRSEHNMRHFPQNFRGDAGFMERTCPHGVGHPDPDDPQWRRAHGCDGCCALRPPQRRWERFRG